MAFDPSTAKLVEPSQENLTLYSSNPSMQNTIDDIEAGKPAPALSWNGKPMGKHGRVFDPSTADPTKGEAPDKKRRFDPSTADPTKGEAPDKKRRFDPSTADPTKGEAPDKKSRFDSSTETTTQKVIGNAASALDVVIDTIPFVLRTLDETSWTENRLILSTINPNIHAGTAAQDATKDAHETFDRFFNPLSKLVDLLYKDKHIVDKSAVQQIQKHIGGMLAKPVEYTEKHYGKEAAAYVQELEDGLMVIAPKVVKGLSRKLADIKTAPEDVPEGDLAKSAEDIKTITKVNPPAEEPPVPSLAEESVEAPKTEKPKQAEDIKTDTKVNPPAEKLSVPSPAEGPVEAPKKIEEPVAEITNTEDIKTDTKVNPPAKELSIPTFIKESVEAPKRVEEPVAEITNTTEKYTQEYLDDAWDEHTGEAQPKGYFQERRQAKIENAKQESLDAAWNEHAKEAQPKYYSPERGQADVKVLAGMALISGAAIAGYAVSPEGQKIEGAVLGGIGSIILARSLPKAASLLKNDFRGAIFKATLPTSMVAAGVYFNPDRKVEGALAGLGLWGWGELPAAKPIPAGDLFRANYNNKIAAERMYTNMANKMKVKVPEQTRRVEIISAYETDTLDNIKLQPHEKEFVGAWKSVMDSFAVAAKDAGIMRNFIENYVPHIIETLGLDGLAAQVKDLFGFSQGGAGGSSRFTKERKYATFKEVNDVLEGSGLHVKTMDPAEILPIYARAMTNAIENKNLIEGLKGAAIAGDKRSAGLVQSEDKAPYDYKSGEGIAILNGLRVHPEIVDPLKMLLKGRTTNELAKAAVNVNAAIKRLGVSFSLFHGKSLIEAALLAGGRKAVAPDGVKAALYMFHNGGLGDHMDFLIREGGLVMKHPSDVDVQSIEKVGKLVDDLTGTKVAGKVAKKFDAVQSAVDRLTWDIAHTGLKGNLALTLLHQWDSTKSFMGKDFSNLTREQAARQISSFVNDTFGGLNWYQVFEESRTALGRKLAVGLLNPKGRDMLQLAIFAPDWTLSTLRAWYKAIPGYSGDLNNALAAKYVMRTAIIYGSILNAANYALVGRPIWDNKDDSTRLDLPDGRSMQVIKHSAEATELLQNPSKYMSNKLSFFPQAGLIALSGKEYINGPKVDSKLAAILGKVAPFGAQAMLGTNSSPIMEERIEQAIAGEFGFGLYGQTKEDKMERIRQQARKDRKEAKRNSTR
jgi:hypothetical protein